MYGLCNNKEDEWNFIEVLSSVLSFVDNLKELINKPTNCTRCDRSGHTEENCFARTYKNGDEIIEYVDVYYCDYCDKEFSTEKGALYHENIHCKNKQNSKKTNKNACFRCGREGHYANNCYANK